MISLIEKRDIHWLRLSAINLIVFIVILGLIEIAARTIFDQETEPGLEAFITSRPPPFHEDTSFEEVVKQFNNSCNYPSPEIVLHEGLPTYTQDFSCGGITLHDGYRLTTNQPQDSLFKVHVFGGSTVWGLGSIDRNTLPSTLQRQLNEYFPEKFLVTNHGFESLVAKQQLERLSRLKISPDDVVIFYDGGNDIWLGGLYGTPSGTIIGYNQESRLVILVFNFKIWLSKNIATYSLLSRLKNRFLLGENNGDLSCPISETEAVRNSEAGSDLYLKYIEDADNLVKRSGGKFFHFFQPTLLALENPTEYEQIVIDKTPCYKEAQAAYRIYKFRYAQLSQQNNNAYDFSDYFSGRDLFFDWIHVGARGNQIMGQHIFDTLDSAGIDN